MRHRGPGRFVSQASKALSPAANQENSATADSAMTMATPVAYFAPATGSKAFQSNSRIFTRYSARRARTPKIQVRSSSGSRAGFASS